MFLLLLLLASYTVTAQEKRVQNRPYTDLRPFHFGVVVGTHIQDIMCLELLLKAALRLR